MLTRRLFFRSMALPAAAAVQAGTQSKFLPPASGSVRSSAPAEADLAEPAAEKYFRHGLTDLFVRLEELDPADPGLLSGALLRISQYGEFMLLRADIEAFQRGGQRLPHCLGCLDAAHVAAIASFDPHDEDGGFRLRMADLIIPEALSPVDLELIAGGNPELRLYIGGHCLGVLNGDLLLRLFSSLRMRRALTDEEAI